jgi:hypothetical protein
MLRISKIVLAAQTLTNPNENEFFGDFDEHLETEKTN